MQDHSYCTVDQEAVASFGSRQVECDSRARTCAYLGTLGSGRFGGGPGQGGYWGCCGPL